MRAVMRDIQRAVGSDLDLSAFIKPRLVEIKESVVKTVRAFIAVRDNSSVFPFDRRVLRFAFSFAAFKP